MLDRLGCIPASLGTLGTVGGRSQFSLPEIGSYTDPVIFVKKKSERIFKNVYRPKLMLCVFFLWEVNDYFCSRKIFRSKTRNFFMS